MTNPDEDLRHLFFQRAGIPPTASIQEVVEAVRQIPHARPSERSARGVVKSWRGTCSTKLLLLDAILPELDLRFVNRVFRLTPSAARAKLGERPAAALPPEGIVDVHTYATGVVEGRRIVIDVTFPGGSPWDGTSDMEIPWPLGEDFDAGDDPIASKEALIARLGDPKARARLIEAIS
jgi:hypothetical protein